MTEAASTAISCNASIAWAESWILQWTPEAEIQIVEAVLKGDTVEQAAAFALKKRTYDDNKLFHRE